MTTREQIIAAGFKYYDKFPDKYQQKLIALFEAGCIAGRESCVKLCESYRYRMDAGIEHIITAIQAGDTK